MEKLSSSFSWKSLATRLFLTFFFLVILAAGVFAAPNGVGTLYEKWMQEIFVSLPEGNNASTTPLSNPTVQRAHTIADENGTEVARGAVSSTGEKTLLIGTDFASDDTVRIYGEDAGIQITAKSGNPEISLGETDGSHGSVYLDSNSGALRVWTGKKEGGVLNGQNALEISGNQINFPEKLQANGTNVITAFTCPADSGVLIGFDTEGNPLCSNNTNKTSWVSVPKEEKYTCSVECGGGTVDFDVKCKSGENYSVLEDDQVCLDLGLEKPDETRECNTFSCG